MRSSVTPLERKTRSADSAMMSKKNSMWKLVDQPTQSNNNNKQKCRFIGKLDYIVRERDRESRTLKTQYSKNNNCTLCIQSPKQHREHRDKLLHRTYLYINTHDQGCCRSCNYLYRRTRRCASHRISSTCFSSCFLTFLFSHSLSSRSLTFLSSHMLPLV